MRSATQEKAVLKAKKCIVKSQLCPDTISPDISVQTIRNLLITAYDFSRRLELGINKEDAQLTKDTGNKDDVDRCNDANCDSSPLQLFESLKIREQLMNVDKAYPFAPAGSSGGDDSVGPSGMKLPALLL